MAARILEGAEFLITMVSKEEVFCPEDFTEEQKQIAETTELFVSNELLPEIEKMEKQNFGLVVEKLRKCGDLGLFMVDAPEEYGGLELDKVTGMLVAEKMGPAGSFSVAFSAHVGLGTLPLLYYGTKKQKEKYLKKLISGEWIAAFCLTEPDAGSDVFGMKTSAVLSEDGGHYLLSGGKQFVTNGGFAGLFTLFAKVDGEKVAAFLVERDLPGVSIGAEEKKMGIKGSSTTGVFLDDVKVPAENLLGQVGKGHKIAFNVLNIGRLKLGAAVTGAAKSALGESVRYACERRQFGKSIGSYGAIREKVADMTANIFASESIVYRLAGMMDARLEKIGRGCEDYEEKYRKGVEAYSVECAIAKVFCSDVLALVADETLQIHGGYGFLSEYGAERLYRDERINRIFEGTNEINRLLVTGTILAKALKGEIPLQEEARKAFESLMTVSFEALDESILFEKEKALLKNLKTLYLILAGSAVRKFGRSLQEEQEILLAAADMTIQIFALESAVLRAEKAHAAAGEGDKERLEAVAEVFSFAAAEKVAHSAKKCAFYAEEGESLAMILSGVRRYTKYDATGLLRAKRILADAAMEGGKYIF